MVALYIYRVLLANLPGCFGFYELIRISYLKGRFLNLRRLQASYVGINPLPTVKCLLKRVFSVVAVVKLKWEDSSGHLEKTGRILVLSKMVVHFGDCKERVCNTHQMHFIATASPFSLPQEISVCFLHSKKASKTSAVFLMRPICCSKWNFVFWYKSCI